MYEKFFDLSDSDASVNVPVAIQEINDDAGASLVPKATVKLSSPTSTVKTPSSSSEKPILSNQNIVTPPSTSTSSAMSPNVVKSPISPSPTASENADTPDRKTTVTRYGRRATVFHFDPSAYLTVFTSEHAHHAPKLRTPGQKLRLVKRIITAKRMKTPGIFADLPK